MLKHLWYLCTDGDNSIWSNWVRSYLLRNKSFWEVRCPGYSSWVWRKMKKLRSIARRKMLYRVGTGDSLSLWFDYWHPIGPLICKYGERKLVSSRLGRGAKVSTIVDGKDWKWPVSQSIDLLELQRATPVNLKPDNSRRDVLTWVDDPRACFSVGNAWESIRSRGPRVSWHKIVWFNKAIPRHAMILWLAIRDGLYTQSFLLAFGVIREVKCTFFLWAWYWRPRPSVLLLPFLRADLAPSLW